MQTNMPIRLSPARVWRTYTGGKLIDLLHGVENACDSHFTEEWIISAVAARNTGREEFAEEGLSFSVDGKKSLAELITENPLAMLGKHHLKTVGLHTGVLVKLIDSSERLTIQVHPDKTTARWLFHSEFGKTECWHIVNSRMINGEIPCIYLGFKPGITRERWKQIFDAQDIPAMLDCLHKFPVKEGDTFLIPGGIPHAIGSGCFLAEIQEPTDFSIRTERVTPSGFAISDFMCHQGIGFDAMFDCFTYKGAPAEEIYAQYHIAPRQKPVSSGCRRYELVGYDDTPCFKLELYEVGSICVMPCYNTFYGLYVFTGEGEIQAPTGMEPVRAGYQYFVPASAAPFSLVNNGAAPMRIFCCFGPNSTGSA